MWIDCISSDCVIIFDDVTGDSRVDMMYRSCDDVLAN